MENLFVVHDALGAITEFDAEASAELVNFLSLCQSPSCFLALITVSWGTAISAKRLAAQLETQRPTRYLQLHNGRHEATLRRAIKPCCNQGRI